MQVILQGSLRHFAAADLLGFLCRPGHKGTLDLESGGRRTRIHFENGTILSAQSKKAEGADAVIDVLEWQEGTFTVLDAVVVPAGVKPLALELPALFAEVKRRAEEKTAGFPDQTYFHVIENPSLQQQVSLTAEEFKLLFRLAAGRTFSELLAEFAVPRRELADRLKRFQEMGLITVESSAGNSSVPAAPQSSTSPPSATQHPPAQPAAKPDVGTMPIAAPVSREQDIRTVAEMPIPTLPEAERTMMQAAPPKVRPATQAATPAPVAPAPPAAPAPEPAAVAPAKRSPTLVGSLTPDEAPDNVFPLLDSECVIGRKQTKEVAFAVNDGSISSKHARLQRTPEGFYIEDLGSKNGTFVNGEKVSDKRLLADGDLIRLGKVIMTFNVASETQRSDTTQPELRME